MDHPKHPETHLSPAEARKLYEGIQDEFEKLGILTTTDEIKAGLGLLRRNGLDAAKRYLDVLDRITPE